MTFSTQNNPFSKLLVCTAVVMLAGIYSCNDSATTEKEVTPPVTDSTMNATDTAMKMSTDSTMKMSADSGSMKMKSGAATSDTGGKGGQPTPPGHATNSATGSTEQPH